MALVDDDDAMFHLECIGDASKQIFLSNTLINAFEADFYHLKQAMMTKIEELKSENEEMKIFCDSELDRASVQLQSLGEERARLMHSNHDLQTKYDDLNTMFHEMNVRYDEQYQDLVEKYNSLQVRYDEQLDIDQSLKIEYEEYKNQCDKSITKYIANSANERNTVDSLTKGMAEMKELLQQATRKETETSQQLQLKDEELVQCRSAYETKEAKANRQHIVALTDLESKVIDLERKLNRSIDVETSLRGNNAAMNHYVSALKEQLDQKELLHGKIERSHNNLRSYLEAKNQLTIDTVSTTMSPGSDTSTDVFGLILEHEKKQNALFESKTSDLKGQMELAIREKDSSMAKVAELQSLVSECMAQLNTSMESEKQLQLAVANHEINYSTLLGENAKLQGNITQLLQFKVEDANNMKLQFEKEIENMEVEKYKLKDSNNKLQQLLDESNAIQGSLQKSVSQLTDSLMREMDNNNQLTSKNELLQLSLSRSKGMYNASIYRFIIFFREIIFSLFTHQLPSIRCIESEQSYLKMMGDQTISTKQICDQYEGKISQLESRLASSNTENERYIQAMQEEIASFKDRVNYSQLEIEKLNKSIEKLKNIVSEKEKEMGDLCTRYDISQNALKQHEENAKRSPVTIGQHEDQQLAAYKQSMEGKLLYYQQKISSLQEQLSESVETNNLHLQEISSTRQQQLDKVRQVIAKAVSNQKASESEIQRLNKELFQLKMNNGAVPASDNEVIAKLQEQLTLLKANYDLLAEENALMKGEPQSFLY